MPCRPNRLCVCDIFAGRVRRLVVFRVRIQVSALITAARPLFAPADRRIFVTYWPTVASVFLFFFIIKFVYKPRSIEIISKPLDRFDYLLVIRSSFHLLDRTHYQQCRFRPWTGLGSGLRYGIHWPAGLVRRRISPTRLKCRKYWTESRSGCPPTKPSSASSPVIECFPFSLILCHLVDSMRSHAPVLQIFLDFVPRIFFKF